MLESAYDLNAKNACNRIFDVIHLDEIMNVKEKGLAEKDDAYKVFYERASKTIKEDKIHPKDELIFNLVYSVRGEEELVKKYNNNLIEEFRGYVFQNIDFDFVSKNLTDLSEILLLDKMVEKLGEVYGYGHNLRYGYNDEKRVTKLLFSGLDDNVLQYASNFPCLEELSIEGNGSILDNQCGYINNFKIKKLSLNAPEKKCKEDDKIILVERKNKVSMSRYGLLGRINADFNLAKNIESLELRNVIIDTLDFPVINEKIKSLDITNSYMPEPKEITRFKHLTDLVIARNSEPKNNYFDEDRYALENYKSLLDDDPKKVEPTKAEIESYVVEKMALNNLSFLEELKELQSLYIYKVRVDDVSILERLDSITEVSLDAQNSEKHKAVLEKLKARGVNITVVE